MTLFVDIYKKLPGFHLEVSFRAKKSTLGLLGPSGSGKSMTLRCVAGLETPDRGHISLGGKVLFDSDQGINLPPQKRKVGFLFQNYALFPHLTVRNNIAVGLGGVETKERARIIEKMISLVKLHALEERYPHQLSGGQQQRVALARALATRPDILLMDEPFSALDNHLRGEMEQEIRNLLSSFPGIALFVTHNLDEAYRLCPNMVILDKGKIAANASKKKILDSPPTLEVARMLGCQNLSGFTIHKDNQVAAHDWGCLLQLPAGSNKTKKGFVGIYNNHVRLAKATDSVNTVDCQVIEIIESPHYVTIKTESVKPDYTGCLTITLPKDDWDQKKIEEFQPLKLYLPPERLFII